jgi:hypothetical protein
MQVLSPIVLFTYNRLDETKKTVEALQKNFLAKESDLYVYSDGWKNEIDRIKVIGVRNFLKQIDGFKSVKLVQSDLNKGLAKSIIDGVTEVIKRHGKVIVLEDDLITSPNFLNFNNQALKFYEFNENIFSISGYTLNLSDLKKKEVDFYYSYRASSWGWSTWLDRWENVDWDVKDYNSFIKSSKLKREFARGGSDLPQMLINQMNGKIDSWAIRWCFYQFLTNQLTIFPTKSKIISIGFGENATHTRKTKRFETELDTTLKENFYFNESIKLDKNLIYQFKAKFSIYNRVIEKVMFKIGIWK